MTRIFFILFLIVFSYSCKNDHEIIKEYDENGKLKWEIPMTSDHKKDGILIEYYPNGAKRNEIEYKANIQNGIKIGYYENGKKKYQGYYINGMKDSIWTYYYDSGEKQQIENWLKGHILGETKVYFQNGKLQKYKFYTFKDKLLYIVEFNEDDKIINEEGQFFFISYNKNNLNVHDTADINIHIGLPYIYDCTYLVKKLSEKSVDTIYYHHGYNSLPYNRFSHIMSVRVPCESIENFSIVLSAKKISSISDVYYYDTVKFHIR